MGAWGFCLVVFVSLRHTDAMWAVSDGDVLFQLG